MEVVSLESEYKRLTDRIKELEKHNARLIEAGDALAQDAMDKLSCCDKFSYSINHSKECPITLWESAKAGKA